MLQNSEFNEIKSLVVNNRILLEFLSLAKSSSLYKTQYSEVLMPTIKYILSKLTTNEKDDIIAQIQTSTGDCPTSVVNFIIQQYIGIKVQEGASIDDIESNVLEKEAVRAHVIKNLKHQSIEYVENLLDFLYLEGYSTTKFKIINKKNFSHSSLDSPYKFNLNYSNTVIENFAKLVCMTDKEGNLITSKHNSILRKFFKEDKKTHIYIRDDEKIKKIFAEFLRELGIMTAEERCINNAVDKIMKLLQGEKYEDMMTCYKDARVINLISPEIHRKKLEHLLVDKTLEQYEGVCRKYIEEIKEKLDTLDIELLNKSPFDINCMSLRNYTKSIELFSMENVDTSREKPSTSGQRNFGIRSFGGALYL